MGTAMAKAGRIGRNILRGVLLGAVGLALMLVLDVVLLDRDREPGTGNRERS